MDEEDLKQQLHDRLKSRLGQRFPCMSHEQWNALVEEVGAMLRDQAAQIERLMDPHQAPVLSGL